jgi:glycosyltransferase involved in cell wall biosynthesis
MLNRIIRKVFPKKNKALLDRKVLELKELRKRSDEIVICGSTTEGSWLGISNATHSLFPDKTYTFPQWFSHPVFKDKEMKVWKETLIGLQFTKITISGFAAFFFDFISEFGENQHIEVIYHGTWSEMHDKERRDWMTRLFHLTSIGKIKKIGFIKKGMAETVHQLYGFDCKHIPLPPPKIPMGIQKLDLDRSKFHIGVFGADTFNKNLHNQVVHALIIENSIIHVLDKSIFEYLNMSDRIVEHGKNLPKETFLQILGSMDLNLYMSYSESWGLVAYESEAIGVPCLTQETIDYFSKIKMKSKKSVSKIEKQ